MPHARLFDSVDMAETHLPNDQIHVVTPLDGEFGAKAARRMDGPLARFRVVNTDGLMECVRAQSVVRKPR